jgi:aspartokinase
MSVRTGITLVSMETSGMWHQVGFLADVFQEFKRHGLSVDLIGAAETNVTVSLDPTENLVNSDVLSALCDDLAKVCRVKVLAPCAAVTLVGRGMRGPAAQARAGAGRVRGAARAPDHAVVERSESDVRGGRGHRRAAAAASA